MKEEGVTEYKTHAPQLNECGDSALFALRLWKSSCQWTN